MKTMAACLCIVGGILWGMKPLYDFVVIGRQINTGYFASDWTDYVKFVFPLLCLGGIYVLHVLYSRKLKNPLLLLSAALVFNGLFHFFEIYFPDTGIPFGLLFLFSGTVLLAVGSFMLMRRISFHKEIPRVLLWLTRTLFAVTLLFCLSPFLTGLFQEQFYTMMLISLMMAVGFIWAGIGGALLAAIQGKADAADPQVENSQNLQL